MPSGLSACSENHSGEYSYSSPFSKIKTQDWKHNSFCLAHRNHKVSWAKLWSNQRALPPTLFLWVGGGGTRVALFCIPVIIIPVKAYAGTCCYCYLSSLRSVIQKRNQGRTPHDLKENLCEILKSVWVTQRDHLKEKETQVWMLWPCGPVALGEEHQCDKVLRKCL